MVVVVVGAVEPLTCTVGAVGAVGSVVTVPEAVVPLGTVGLFGTVGLLGVVTLFDIFALLGAVAPVEAFELLGAVSLFEAFELLGAVSLLEAFESLGAGSLLEAAVVLDVSPPAGGSFSAVTVSTEPMSSMTANSAANNFSFKENTSFRSFSIVRIIRDSGQAPSRDGVVAGEQYAVFTE